jgi:hypothetical protein
MFFQGSRYEDVPEAVLDTPAQGPVRYKRVRFIPPTPASLAHEIVQDERLDHLAFLAYRDPERFWRICDANFATWPPDLVAQVGARVLIPPAKG